jgi:hypothetical protein
MSTAGPSKKLRAVFETFDSIHGLDAILIRHNYPNLVDTIFATFKSAVDSLLVESQSLSTDGIVNGNTAGVALKNGYQNNPGLTNSFHQNAV